MNGVNIVDFEQMACLGSSKVEQPESCSSFPLILVAQQNCLLFNSSFAQFQKQFGSMRIPRQIFDIEIIARNAGKKTSAKATLQRIDGR
jgi:hypothetical protein